MAYIPLKLRRDQIKFELQSLNDARLEAFIKANNRPEFIYKCGHIGEIDKLKVNRLYVSYPGLPYQAFNHEPTRVYIAKLEDHLMLIRAIEPKILVEITTKHGGTTAEYWDDVLSHKSGCAFNEEDLKELSDHNREIYAPREGFTACEYCGVQVKNEELVLKPIWGKSRLAAGSTYTTKENYCFCSGTCAMHAQMSREG